MILAWPLSVSQGKAELLPVMMSLSPMLMLASMSWIYLANMKRLLRYEVTALDRVVSVVTGGVVGVSLAYCGAGVWSLVGQQVSGALAAFAILFLNTNWRPTRMVPWRHLRELVRFASNTSLAGLLDFLGRRIDIPILGFFLDVYSVGIYFVAARLSTTGAMISLYVAYDLAMAVLPRFDRRTQAFREAAYRTLQLTMLFTLPLFIFVALFADEMILLLFGPGWSGSVQPLRVMCMSSVVYAFTLIGRQVLNAAGCAGLSLVIAAVNAVVYAIAVLLAAASGPPQPRSQAQSLPLSASHSWPWACAGGSAYESVACCRTSYQSGERPSPWQRA